MRISYSIPTSASVESWLQAENALPLTYAPVEATRSGETVGGYDNDQLIAVIGRGDADFERAKAALSRWAHFPASWTAIRPAESSIEAGTPVAMFFRLFGLWWRNSCRIIYVIDEADRYGFAYGTLPGHIESGEEIFWVARRPDDQVEYGIRAFSQPRLPIVRLGYPIARLLQEKFRQDSARAMHSAVQGDSGRPFSPDRWVMNILSAVFALVFAWNGSFMGHDYSKIPLVVAFFIFVPLIVNATVTATKQPVSGGLLWVAGATAALALFLPVGWAAALCAFPWFVVAAFHGWRGRKSPLPLTAAYLFWCVGAAWFLAERMGRPVLGFGAEWSLLTALHFHYAGLGLPIIAAAAARRTHRPLHNHAAMAAVWGMILTATGITASRFGMNEGIESVTAVYTALVGAWIAIILWQAGRAQRLWTPALAGVILLATMSLAFIYALRFLWPQWALSIDEMRAWHGSLNVVALILAAKRIL